MTNNNDFLADELNDIEFRKAFGKKIKRLRLDKDITQERLGFLAKLDRTYIGGLERGERNITLSNIKKIADALKIPVIELFKFEEAQNYEPTSTTD